MTSARHATATSSTTVRRRDLRTARTEGNRTPRHAASRPGRMLRNVAVILVGVLAFSGTAATAVVANLQGEVESLDIGDLINTPSANADGEAATTAPPADPNAGTALNILVIGSDSRADGGAGDDTTSVLADTHIIMHISADRSRVELVSIPRDTMVEIPECRTTSGETIRGRFGMYNSAFAEAWLRGEDKTSAVACDMNLANSITGLTMDGFVLVEMAGFINMVDALGGVDICIPEPIDSPKAHLELDAGQQTLDGTQALGYARARKGDGLSGSDPDRIARQQRLMSAMVDEILSRNVLADGPALYQMLNAALSSLTVSENLGKLTDVAGLALSLRSLGSDDVTFLTVPYAAYEPDPNRLVMTSAVDDIWAALAADTPIPTASSEDEPTEAPSSGVPSADPSATGSSATPTEAGPTEAGTAGANAEDLTQGCTAG